MSAYLNPVYEAIDFVKVRYDDHGEPAVLAHRAKFAEL